MDEPLLKTKIIPPRVPDYTLHRNRLLKTLELNLDKRIISICADAGYGKTTLLAQFVKNLDMPYTWYQVDKSDYDLSLFIKYIIEGIRRFMPKFGKRTLNIINHARGHEIKHEILVGTFINELLEIPNQRILFLFDDLQEIYGFKKIISGFEYLLNHIPPNISIFISARSNPPFSLDRFHLKNETLDIDQQDLKFTKEEIKILCQQIGGYKPHRTDIEKFETDSGGWITYLQFLIQPSKQTSIFSKGKKSLINRLYDYFDKEVYSSLDDELKFFLITTSVFDRFSPEACDFLLSKKNSKKTLKELEQKHLFISTYDVPQPLYGYHRLFLEFLSKELKKTGLYQKFQNRAGMYWKKQGVLSTAVEHYFEGNNFKAAARLIEKFGNEYIKTGKSELIKHYMNNLPDDIITNSPILLRVRGNLCFWNCDWDGARTNFYRARRIAQRQKNYREVFEAILCQLVVKIDLREYKGVATQIRKALRSKKLRSRKMRGRFLNNLGCVYLYEGKLKQATKVFEETLKVFRNIGDSFFINMAIHNLGVVNLEIGNYARARRYLETVVEEERANLSLQLVFVLYNLGFTLMMQGELVQAEEVFEEACKYAQLFNDKDNLCGCYEAIGLIKMYSGALEQAEDFMNKAEKLGLEIGHKFRLFLIRRSMAELAINRGNFFKAKQYIGKEPESPIPLVKASQMTTKAKIELSLGNYDIAEKTLGKASTYLGEEKYQRVLFNLQMARLYLHKKNEKQVKNYVYKSIRLAEKNSYDFLLLYELKHCPEIIKFLRKINLRSSYFQHVLLKLPDSKTIEILAEPDKDVYDFIVRLFDKVYVMKKRKEIKPSSWRTKRFQELFSFFMVNQGRVVTREKIMYTFWPDHNPATAKQLFYNALYWIRKIASKHIIVFTRKGYTLSPQYKYWIDTQEFENLINKGDRSVRGGNRAAGLLLYEQAVSLYRAEFMDEFYSEWCQQQRRYFEGLYLYALRKLSNGHYKIGNFEKALNFCTILISKDPLYEEAHCLAMQCYAALNDLGGLQKCFSHLKKVLAKELKTTPRPMTVKLFKTLIKQRKKQ